MILPRYLLLTDSRKHGSLKRVGMGLNSRQLLPEASLRVTRPRMAVLSVVHAHPHSDTESIISAARAVLPQLSHQTVYDSLRTLTAVGLLRCFQPAGSPARYEFHVENNHHHVVCRRYSS